MGVGLPGFGLLLNPRLEKKHAYAIGTVMKDGFAPIRTYNRISFNNISDEVKQDFSAFYEPTVGTGRVPPVIAQKISGVECDENTSWMVLQGLTEKVIKEIEKESLVSK